MSRIGNEQTLQYPGIVEILGTTYLKLHFKKKIQILDCPKSMFLSQTCFL